MTWLVCLPVLVPLGPCPGTVSEAEQQSLMDPSPQTTLTDRGYKTSSVRTRGQGRSEGRTESCNPTAEVETRSVRK